MAKIKIKNLLVRTYIGFNPDELINKQDIIINMAIEAEISESAMEKDEPIDIFDYKTITKKVIQHVQDGRFKLLEVLTKSILDLIMKDKQVKWAKVEVDKPHALRFAESVSIEMQSSR